MLTPFNRWLKENICHCNKSTDDEAENNGLKHEGSNSSYHSLILAIEELLVAIRENKVQESEEDRLAMDEGSPEHGTPSTDPTSVYSSDASPLPIPIPPPVIPPTYWVRGQCTTRGHGTHLYLLEPPLAV